MPKLSSVTRCRRVPKNTRGRDLVVGDLHGHRALLETELERLGFDPSRDRLFSVGDLIDRGPDSLGTASLIDEPWFFAVLGNHELMLLNYLGYYNSRQHSRKSFAGGCGEWVRDAMAQHPLALRRAARLIARLPLVIHVSDDVPFSVVHSDLVSLGTDPLGVSSADCVSVHTADRVTCSRRTIAEAAASRLIDLRFEDRTVRLSESPVGPWPLTYVGHSPMRDITVHRSHVCIDQGVCCSRNSGRGEQRPPTVIEHRRFAYWLGGVSSASGQAAPVRLAWAA